MAFASGDPVKEIATAEVHAQLSSTVKDIDIVHQHLHHVLNCLVGPNGKQFDSATLNPCKDISNGAIPDLGNDKKMLVRLEKVVGAAEQGVAATEFNNAHATAARVAAMLKMAAKSDHAKK